MPNKRSKHRCSISITINIETLNILKDHVAYHNTNVSNFIEYLVERSIEKDIMSNQISKDKQRISSSLDKKLVRKISDIANKEGVSLTEVIKTALEKFVKDYAKPTSSK